MLHAHPKQAHGPCVSCGRNARCSSLEIGTAAEHTNVNVSYEKPYKGHKCIQNKINNDRDAMCRA